MKRVFWRRRHDIQAQKNRLHKKRREAQERREAEERGGDVERQRRHAAGDADLEEEGVERRRHHLHERVQRVALGGALPDSEPLRARQRHLAAICEHCRPELDG